MNPRRRLTRLLAAALPALLLLGPLQGPATAGPLPDLRVKRVSADASTVAQGGQLSVKDTTANTGRVKAGRSKTRYHLSRDRSYSRKDRALGIRKVPALKPDGKNTGSQTVVVPAATPTGQWYVLACADAKQQVKESKEGNNCRATSDPVTVTEPTSTVTFPMEPDPLTVGPSTLEVENQVTATAGTDAPTTITATGSDGTTYTLHVPPTALLSEEEITLTPVAAVADLPLADGLRAAVQLEPHGLMLQEPATLVIDSPDLGALSAQTPFVFHDDGEDLHPYPVESPAGSDDADVVRLNLTHFSTAGVGAATTADRSSLASHPPARTSSQLAAANAELTRAERESVESGNPPDPAVGQQMITNLEAYATQVVIPQMDAAAGNPDLAPGAISEAIAVARQIALLGDEDNPVAAQLMQKALQLLESLIDPLDQRCQQHDIRAIGLLVGLARQLALLGGAESPAAARAWDAALRCAQYEVTFDSTMDYTRNYTNDGWTVTNDDHLRLQSTTQVAALSPGVSVLDYTEASVSHRQEGDGAWLENHLVSTQPGSINVDVLARANPRDPGPGGTPAPPMPFVRLLPGIGAEGVAQPPTEHIELTSSLGEPSEYDTTYWMNQVIAFSEFYPLGYEEDLEPQPGNAVLLEKTHDNTFGSVTAMTGYLTEHRVVKVTHTPEAG